MPEYRRIKIKGGTYFFTLVTNKRQEIFSSLSARILFMDALHHVREYHPFNVLAYCLLPDHVHLLWEMPNDDANYSMRMGEIKKYFSKHYLAKPEYQESINRHTDKSGRIVIWQKRFWEHFIRDELDLHKHLDYIHYNPVKHGLVNRAYDWSASSFADYVLQGYYDKDWGLGENAEIDFHTYGE